MRPWHDVEAIERAVSRLGQAAVRDAPLGARTTYRVGGVAAVLVEVHDAAGLHLVADAARESGLATLTVGKGSNMLVADEGFEGIVVVLGGEFERLDVDAEGVVTAGGAVALPVLARRSVAAGRRGLEWAVGVPGTVGGAVRMNAGGHGSDMSECVVSVDVFDLATGDQRTWTPSELNFGYRTSALGDQNIVLHAHLAAAQGDVATGEALISEIVQWRRANQPGGQNAGSVFVNPDETSAGAEIDRLGLKGHRRGTAEVSPKHANFIQADEGGRAQDVADLMDEVAGTVERETGTVLRTEIRRVGRFA